MRKTPPLKCGPEGYLRLALCQIETQPWELDGNLERTLAAVSEAADQGADLAVTPECVLSGYPPMHDEPSRARAIQSAVSVASDYVKAVSNLARERNMTVLLGFAELEESTRRIHNAALLLHADGTHGAKYHKVHCRSFEDAGRHGIFTPGERFVVAPVASAGSQSAGGDPFNVGLMICFDREIPETVRCLRALGAQLVVCPLATDTKRLDSGSLGEADNELVTRCRAAENELFIAVVNHAGTFNGGSFVVGPAGESLVQLGSAPEVRVITLPVGATGSFHSDPLGWMGWGYRRPAVYAEYLK